MRRYCIRNSAAPRGIPKNALGTTGPSGKISLMAKSVPLTFSVEGTREVSVLLLHPDGGRWLLLLAHGAGAGMRHPFMECLSRELATFQISISRSPGPS